VLYTGINILELRARAFFRQSGRHTEFGERMYSTWLELQARLYLQNIFKNKYL
jgi:hypothetical protein